MEWVAPRSSPVLGVPELLEVRLPVHAPLSPIGGTVEPAILVAVGGAAAPPRCWRVGEGGERSLTPLLPQPLVQLLFDPGNREGEDEDQDDEEEDDTAKGGTEDVELGL